MPLPLQKSEITAELDKAFWVVYGPPGVGKSTFVSEFPDPIFATTEQAHRHLNIFNRPISGWKDFQMFVLEMQSKDGARFRSIGVDTVDLLYKMCLEQVCSDNGMEHPSDEEWGKGYDLVNTAFQREIIKLTLLSKGIFFVSHSKTKDVTARNMKYTKTVPSMSNGCHKIILPLVDIEAYIGFSSNDVSHRAAIFEPRESLEAKDRFGRFPKEVVLPKGKSYASLKAAWAGLAGALPVTSVQPAQPVAQAAAVRRVIRKV